MKQQRNTDQNGRMLKGSDRNVNEWQITKTYRTAEGVRIEYISGRKLSGASYVLELTDAEMAMIWITAHNMSNDEIAEIMENV